MFLLLTPQNTDSSDWSLSTYMGPVQVEGEDEIHARLRASEYFWRQDKSNMNKYSARNPWCRPDLTKAQILIVRVPGLPFLSMGKSGHRGISSEGA